MDTEALIAPERAVYAAEQTARSDQLVAAGCPPLRRMQAPFMPAYVEAKRSNSHRYDGASSWDVRTAKLQAVLVRIGPDGLEAAAVHGLHSDRIDLLPVDGLATMLCELWALDNPPMMVFETLTAARRLWTVAPRFAGTYTDVNEAADDLHKKVAHQLEVIAALPSSSRMVVLDRALNQLFWRPAAAGEGTFKEWRPLLSSRTGFEAMQDVLGHLLAGSASPSQVTFATAMVRAEDQLVGKVSAFRNAGTATHHYNLSTRFQTAFDAYRCADPDFLMEACTAGTAPWVRPIGVEDKEVVAQLSTPCRLKPGRVRLYTPNGAEIGRAKLRRLTFSERLGLVGVFGTDGRVDISEPRGRRGVSQPESHGYQWLITEGRRDSGRVAHMVEVPYLSSGGSSTWTWTRDDFKGPAIHRDVPLDVSIAGAGS